MAETREIHPIALSVITLMTHEATDVSEIVCSPELAAELEPALLALSGSEELRFALAGLLDFVNTLEHAGTIDTARSLLAAIETPRVLSAVRALNEQRQIEEHKVVSSARRQFARMSDRKRAPDPAVVGSARPASSVPIDALGFPRYI
jgi:hypothetical protein